MAATTTITFHYVCDECGLVDDVSFEVRDCDIYPQPFVRVQGTLDYLMGQAAFVKLMPSGKVVCVSCKAGGSGR